MHKALHPKFDIDWLYVSGKEGRKRLSNIEERVDTSIRRLEDCIKYNEKWLITATRNSTSSTRINKTTITRKQKWEGR